MRRLWLFYLALSFSVISGPAFAGEQELAQPESPDNWSLSAAGGATIIEDGGDQPFLRLGLTRILGDGYVHGAVTHFAVRDALGFADVVPATTWQVSLGGGYRFGKVTLDGYGAIGWRQFQKEEFFRRGGGDITIDSNGKTLSGGISLAYEIGIDERSALSPFIAGDISRIDTARAIEVGTRGTIAHKERQTSETGSVGLTVDRLLGTHSNHRLSAYGAFVTTSNSAVAIRSSAPIEAARLFGPLDYPGFNQSWAEYGGSATVSLSRSLLIDLSAVRTAGFQGGESTNLLAGLRFHF